MSRTIRIKNHYPTGTGESWAVGEWIFLTPEIGPYWRYTHVWQRIDPNDRKAYGNARRKRHKESSHSNERSPNRWHRQNRENQYRSQAKAELHRFMLNPEHEVNLSDRPSSHYWDWN